MDPCLLWFDLFQLNQRHGFLSFAATTSIIEIVPHELSGEVWNNAQDVVNNPLEDEIDNINNENTKNHNNGIDDITNVHVNDKENEHRKSSPNKTDVEPPICTGEFSLDPRF